MRLIDAHLHLDPRGGKSALQAVTELTSQMKRADVEGANVLHLLAQPWPLEEFAEAVTSSPRLKGFVNVDPFRADAIGALRAAKEQLGFKGLKLHPRLQRFDIRAPEVARLVGSAGDLEMPVIIDAFPDGDWLMSGFDPLSFAQLARSCPKTKVVVAHFGGHHCIDFLMLAKRIPNMWFDISYSFLYYRGSSVTRDLAYCCRSMRFQRVMFGTDYPDRPLDVSVTGAIELLDEYGVVGDDRDRLLRVNAEALFE